MEEFLDSADRLLNQCQSCWNTASLALCDRTAHELQVFVQSITEFVGNQDGTDQNVILLIRYMSLLLVQWETKLMRLEGAHEQTVSGGRPKKIVNIELVGGFFFFF